MYECTKCEKYGLHFQRGYEPVEFIEGKRDSLVWIIGLNPANDQDWIDPRTSQDLENYFDDLKAVHGYFKDFNVVSATIFQNFGKPRGTAHTDIVKCSSRAFPPQSAKGKKAVYEIVNNCKIFLEEQIVKYKPKVIVCNSAEVCRFMVDFLPPPSGYTSRETSYWCNLEGMKICIILSGFIGRIDNFAKRRLGAEIEERLRQAQSMHT